MGILFATVATCFFLGALAAFFQHDPTNTLSIYIIIGAIGCVFAVIAYRLLRKTVPVHTRPCPNCGSFESRPAGVLTRRRSWVLRHTLGFLFETLWAQSQRQQVTCVACENLYYTETKSTRAWGVAVWVVVLLLVIGAIADHFIPDK